MSDSATAALTVGLGKLRASWGYKQTRERARRAGVSFASTILGKAESNFMRSPPTYGAVQLGRRQLHGTWAWNRTKALNVIPSIFERTLIAQADVAFAQAERTLEPVSWGLFAGNGVQCLAPDGGVENVEEYVAGGFKLAAYNVIDHPTAEWANFRRRMAQGGVLAGPWGRCLGPTASLALCNVAKANGERFVIHNVERELDTSYPPSSIADVVRRFPELQHALQPEPWVQNDVDLRPLTELGVVILTESYLNVDPRFLPADLAKHARDLGAGLVAATFGAGRWSDAPYDVPPETYFRAWPTLPYWVYPIDSKDARKWRRP